MRTRLLVSISPRQLVPLSTFQLVSSSTNKEMIKKETVYKIGKIGKPHGVDGEVSFHFDDDIFDRVDADYLILDIDGILVPFFLDEYRFKNDETALVRFADIDSQERVRELTGCDVYFPREHVDTDGEELSWAAIVGFKVIDERTGKVVGERYTPSTTLQSIRSSACSLPTAPTCSSLLPTTSSSRWMLSTKR